MAIIVYLNYDFTISSPDTDHLALTLFLYVLTKWVEMWEEDTVGGGI